jgi:hypothetical protein
LIGGTFIQAASTAASRTIGAGVAREVFVALGPLVLCGGAWLAGRRAVRAFADRSFRRAQTVRRPIAAAGFVVIAGIVAIYPADHTWLSVVLTVAIPVFFAVGAVGSGGRASGRPWAEIHWPRSLPSVRGVLWSSVVLGLASLLAVAAFAATPAAPPASDPDPYIVEPPHLTPQEWWIAAGYGVVAPTLREDRFEVGWSMPREGWLVVDIPDDLADWDAWSDLRFEAWAATDPRDGDGRQTLVDPARGPYLVVPIEDPWTTSKVAVRVGQPDVGAYVLFLVARDPMTGERVAFGHPNGDSVLFHGGLLDWFGVL